MNWQLWLWKLASFALGSLLLLWPLAWLLRRRLAHPPRWLAWGIVVAFFAVLGPLISFLPYTLGYPAMAYFYGWLPGVAVGVLFCLLLPRLGAGRPPYVRGAMVGAVAGALGGLVALAWEVTVGSEAGLLWIWYDTLLLGIACGAALGPLAESWLGRGGQLEPAGKAM